MVVFTLTKEESDWLLYELRWNLKCRELADRLLQAKIDYREACGPGGWCDWDNLQDQGIETIFAEVEMGRVLEGKYSE